MTRNHWIIYSQRDPRMVLEVRAEAKRRGIPESRCFYITGERPYTALEMERRARMDRMGLKGKIGMHQRLENRRALKKKKNRRLIEQAKQEIAIGRQSPLLNPFGSPLDLKKNSKALSEINSQSVIHFHGHSNAEYFGGLSPEKVAKGVLYNHGVRGELAELNFESCRIGLKFFPKKLGNELVTKYDIRAGKIRAPLETIAKTSLVVRDSKGNLLFYHSSKGWKKVGLDNVIKGSPTYAVWKLKKSGDYSMAIRSRGRFLSSSSHQSSVRSRIPSRY